ncbi:FabG Dehydrogenases with different specificities (related to short-chain alcohol dehydrogenases) [Candidatus Pelagibacterales bacterium]
MKADKLLVILGGSGLIGSSIVDYFIKKKHAVINLDIKNNRLKKNNKLYKFYYFDLNESENIEKNLRLLLKNKIIHKFINASYPADENWQKLNFDNKNYEIYKKNLNLHLSGFVLSAKFFANYFKKNKIKGSIVNLNSIYGVRAQDVNLYKGTNINSNMLYPILKAGILIFTKQIASEFGKFGIRANSIICGGVEGHIKGSKKKIDNLFLRKYSAKTMLGRMAKPKDIAPAAYFLSSDEANYITGSEITVDGGFLSK